MNTKRFTDYTEVTKANNTDVLLIHDGANVKKIQKQNLLGTLYGFHIDPYESDPAAKVSYLRDAAGMTPAHMDYTNDVFDYGSWEDAFFMPRPCMLKSDGTVDYYLDPDDYTKKEDGTTASDVANTSYNGNAMMEWGQNGRKIWTKIVPDASGIGGSVYIADHQVDSGFHDWSFHNCQGVSVDHFYTPIYNGSVISSKMRSLSGQQVSSGLTGNEEITAAKLNNPSIDELWNIECLSDRQLINLLLILMGKSTHTQKVFGEGFCMGGSESVNNGFTTGIHNAKGLFYGTNNGAIASNSYENAVKVFGMENYWGFQWRRLNGWILLSDGSQKIKLTYGREDGSGTAGYNLDGANYMNLGPTLIGLSGGYIDKMEFTPYGILPKSTRGDSSHYYCDGLWFTTSSVCFARVGGSSADQARVGAFCSHLNNTASYVSWNLGAALSCKPLA